MQNANDEIEVIAHHEKSSHLAKIVISAFREQGTSRDEIEQIVVDGMQNTELDL